MTKHDEPASQADTIEGHDPFALFAAWLAAAEKAEPVNPNAMALATVDAAGAPNLRMVLLKGADARGFVFYTNLESAKGLELAAHAEAALCFYWKALKRQVRVRGPVEPVSAAEADAYFATRPKDAQIGAWASRQSRPLDGRFELEKEVARYAAKYALGQSAAPAPLVGLSRETLGHRVLARATFPPARAAAFTRESWRRARGRR